MIELRIPQRRRDLGGGMEVGRVLPFARRRMVGPYIFFDHIGPLQWQAGISRSVDVRPHPHIGLSTITYLFAGEIMHRDSVGSEQPIQPGAVNWMTAGRGITHSERFEHARAHGGPMHGIQAWVALPDASEENAPSFTHVPAADLPELQEGDAHGRLIAGEGFGARAPVPVHSPQLYAHWRLPTGARLPVAGTYTEMAAYVVEGEIEIDGARIGAGEMAVFAPGRGVELKALSPATVMVLGGEPVGERFIEWNFVSSSRERIEQAKADWQARRMRLPIHDDQEYIPLPKAPGAEPPPL